MFQQVEYSMVVAMHADRLREAAASRLIHEVEQARPSQARGVRVWAGQRLVALGRRLQVEAPVAAQPAGSRQI